MKTPSLTLSLNASRCRWWKRRLVVCFIRAGNFARDSRHCLALCAVLDSVLTFSESVGSFGVVLRREYGTLLTCVLMVWAAAHLPIVLAGAAIPKFGLGRGRRWDYGASAQSGSGCWSRWFCGRCWACGLTGRSCLSRSGVGLRSAGQTFSVVSPYLFSPFLLFYAFSMFRGDLGDIGFSLRQRQSFRRSMEAATINPRNAEAHYQLGLILLQRRQYNEAGERFARLRSIRRKQYAQYQLGRIARIQNRLQEALDYFSLVVAQDSKHSHHEIWREIGLTYFDAGMFREAQEALQRFVDKRLTIRSTLLLRPDTQSGRRFAAGQRFMSDASKRWARAFVSTGRGPQSGKLGPTAIDCAEHAA